MLSAENYIIDILSSLPNECAYLDYKVIPYVKNYYHDLIRDIIAMLNSEEGLGKEKAIVFGVDDKTHELVGIDSFLKNSNERFDDADYQNIFDKITPRPSLFVGKVIFQEKTFGYVFSPKNMNREWIYEVGETFVSDKTISSSHKHLVMQGQAFTRRGSKNYIMMQNDRERLKKHSDSIIFPDALSVYVPRFPVQSQNGKDSITFAAIIGGWRDDSEDDRNLIELLTGQSYDSWIIPLRKLYENRSNEVIFRNNLWKIPDQKRLLEFYGVQLYDENANAIEEIIRVLLHEYDPRYDLDPSQRCAASIYGKYPKYSPAIRFGISNFLAIAGNFPDLFPSMSKGRIQRLINSAIEELFGTLDWRVLATMEQYFQLLAEASPDCFINAVQVAIRDNKSSLCDYLIQFETGITTTQYGFYLVNALTTIACKREFFSRACYIAFLIVRKQPKHIGNLTSVLLPWMPKTEASVIHRVSLVKQLFEEDQEVAWKLLKSLLPGQTTASGEYVEPKYLSSTLKKQSAIPDTYREEVEQYINISIEKSQNKKDHLIFLIELLDSVTKDLFLKITARIERGADMMDDNEKYDLWNILLNLVNHHRKYPDSDWALPHEALAYLDSTIKHIAPTDKRVQIRRLFQNDTSSILAISDIDYTLIEQELLSMRLNAVSNLIDNYGIDEFINCASIFENIYQVGDVLAESKYIDICDIGVLDWMNSANEKIKWIARDYLYHRYRACGIDWVKLQLSKTQKTLSPFILAALPISDDILSLVELLTDDDSQAIYWRSVSTRCISSTSNMKFAALKLMQYDRPSSALELAYELHSSENDLPNQTIFNLLEQIVKSNDHSFTTTYAYELVALIEYLQDTWDNKDAVILLEWQFYSLFEHYSEKGTVALYNALGTDSNFFMDILCHAFKGNSEERRELNEDERTIAERSFNILFTWRMFPWTKNDGTVDREKLTKWFDMIKSSSADKNRYDVAMSTIGSVFFHSPNDPDGLFIDKTVAKLLNNEENESIRNGYHCEAINSRGAHFVDLTGTPEFALEKQYNERARQIDELGLFRFAKTLRDLSHGYHNEAISNIEESRKWDEESH